MLYGIPPHWVLWFSGTVLLLAFVILLTIPVANQLLKWGIVVGVGVVLLGVLNQARHPNYLRTLIANEDGLFFYMGLTGEYCFIGWRHIGRIEKAVFGVFSKGLRVELIDISSMRECQELGNVRLIDDRWYVYTIPQLLVRDKIIKSLNQLRPPVK